MQINWYRPILAIILTLVISSCGAPTPPTEFAPDGDVIQKAILLQLTQTEQHLSQQLNTTDPKLTISKIKVENIQPIYVAELPTYHLQGTYTIRLSLKRQEVIQKNNPFEIYLQRQVEGKTWRLLRKEINSANQSPEWKSYLVSLEKEQNQ